MSDAPPQDGMRVRPWRGLRTLLILLSILLFLAGSLGGLYWLAKAKATRARAQWKGPALERLAGMSVTNEMIRQEFEDLAASSARRDYVRWTADHVLRMTNGEHIIYVSRHGRNNGFVDHLFLGHASNGQWLYSTYHFCNSMAAVQGEDPPGSIAEFSKRFFVREFDGKSDECLRHTWPADYP